METHEVRREFMTWMKELRQTDSEIGSIYEQDVPSGEDNVKRLKLLETRRMYHLENLLHWGFIYFTMLHSDMVTGEDRVDDIQDVLNSLRFIMTTA